VKIAITQGDANGVGPDILLRWWQQTGMHSTDIHVVYADMAVLVKACRVLGIDAELHPVQSAQEAQARRINVIDAALLAEHECTPGRIDAKVGAAAFAYLQRACSDALGKKVHAIVTLPVCKEAIRHTVPDFTGHTEYIVQQCNEPPYALCLVSPHLVVSHVSTHVSLRWATELVTVKRIQQVCQLTRRLMQQIARTGPLAVMGLNPHAGENNAFGTEESSIILPALKQLPGFGTEIIGPLPPDTVFMRALQGEFSGVVCMYHDQGHIPMKMLDFDKTVNVTAGIDLVRTSVDHGTAFDLAWKATCSLGSFDQAIALAKRMVAYGS